MNRKIKNTNGKSGLTLVEVVVTIALMSLMIAGIYSGINAGGSINYADAQRVVAFGLCKEKLEHMRGVDYTYLVSSNYPSETIDLTHLGGSDRIPLSCTRVPAIATIADPDRKGVTVTVTWDFRGRTFQESIDGVIYFKDGSVAPGGVGTQVVGGEININPNNSPHNEFTLMLSGGGTITRDDLTQNYGGYTGAATLVHVKPKGNGNQNSLTVDGETFPVVNANTYDISSESMTVNLYNDHINTQGKAVGHWWIAITATEASITTSN